MLYRLLYPVARVLMALAYPVLGGIRVSGVEHVPVTGGVLITPNHRSDCDGPTVLYALRRPAWAMVKEELFGVRVLGTILRVMHAFPVKRYTADRTSLHAAAKHLAEGEVVVLFPEGKLTEDGNLQPMLPGALLVAREAHVPIVPTAVLRSDEMLPYGKVIPRRTRTGPVMVRFGPALTIDALTAGARGGDALRLGAERLRACVAALYDDRPYPPLESVPMPERENHADE